MDLTGRTLLGKYEIEGLLGQGGMGAVWRARHALTGRKLAIKTLDESYLENPGVVQRFGREARAASACQHPGIVEVLDLDQTEDGIPILVMELLEGENLSRRIERRGRLEQDEMVQLGTLLLEALEAAHAHGVIHRDLKPENIFVVPAGRRGEIVKILDFGISSKRDETGAKLTMTGSVLGTPHYMSPEQAMGESEVDRRADIYAMGVVLYECAVGDVPFDAPNYNKLLRTILDHDPVPPRRRGAQISESMERLILWAMEKDRERRIGSAGEMLEWLARAAAGDPVPYTPPAASPAARPPASTPPQSAGAPAGSLPARRAALASTMGDEPSAWEPAPAPPHDVPASEPAPRRPTPSERDRRDEAALDVELPPALLEIDEDALRSSWAGAVPKGAASPIAASAVRTGPHAALSRGADVSGRHLPLEAPPPPKPAESPAWVRYAFISAVAIGAFVGLVFLVRWVVSPGVDPPELESERQGLQPEPVRPAPRSDPARAPGWVSVRVSGLPPGGRISLDGLPASSPLRVPSGGNHVLDITAPGYEDRRIELRAERNVTVDADMRPAEGIVQPRR